MPLGLVNSENVDNFWSANTRRKIFYSYPNGTAPLAGLLSLTTTDSTPQPQFSWQEKRWVGIRTTTKAGPTSNCVFYTTGTTTTAGTTVAFAAGTVYRIYLTSVADFQTDDMLKIFRAPLASGHTELSFRVNSKDSTNNFVEAEFIASGTSAAVTNNASTVVGLHVVHMGSAYAEGSRSRSGRYSFPSTITNYTQIFKTPFEMTRTALKAPLTYDKSGAYKDMLKESGINHLAGIEEAMFFGDRRSTTAEDPDTGETVSRRHMGGLLWFLKQWEIGTTANTGGQFDYRGTTSAVPDLTAQTDYVAYRDKRIIRLAGASVTLDQFDLIEALPFQKTNSTEWCKLCLAGAGYISKVNARLKKDVQVTQMRGEQYEGWDFKVTQRTGLQGDIYYKNHPLFNNDEMYNSAFYIDLGYLKYRPLDDSDTDIQQLIQANDADKRKDQWLTECGLEIVNPEAHMFVDNLGGISL